MNKSIKEYAINYVEEKVYITLHHMLLSFGKSISVNQSLHELVLCGHWDTLRSSEP